MAGNPHLIIHLITDVRQRLNCFSGMNVTGKYRGRGGVMFSEVRESIKAGCGFQTAGEDV